MKLVTLFKQATAFLVAAAAVVQARLGENQVSSIEFDAENHLMLGSVIPKPPTVTLNNGVKMPMVGLGTWEYDMPTAYKAVLLALNLGYVHVDTAVMYKNQKAVGLAVRKWMEHTNSKREDVFITTKIPGGLSYDDAMQNLEQSLSELMVDYVDLMLVHFPADWNMTGGKDKRIEGWRAMEDFYQAGKAKAIGVSHFCKRHLLDIMEHGSVKPAVNQVEFHVGMGRAGPEATDDREFVEANGILFQSFSPLCGPCNTDELISGKFVTDIGKKYNKTGAQVSLRWQIQQGIPVIPKTKTEKHLIENADLFNWKLSDEDFEALTNAQSPPVTGGGGDGTSGDCKIE